MAIFYPPEFELKVEISNLDSCQIILEDNTDYVMDNIDFYELFMTVDIIQINKSTSTEISQPIFTKHKYLDCPIILPITFDGWFRLTHIVLPTKLFIDDYELDSETTYYYTDGEKFYKSTDEELTLEELIIELIEVNQVGTSMYKSSEEFFSICNLKKCYVNLCNKIFDTMNTDGRCWNKANIDSDLRFKRDMLWMAINVISYLVLHCNFSEALSILERLNTCNGLCNDMSYVSYLKNSGCGCNRS